MARAFSYFALTANLVEELDEESVELTVSLRKTVAKLKEEGVTPTDVSSVICGAHVARVLAAHPSETRCRTVFDAQTRIKTLLKDSHRGGDHDGTPYVDEHTLTYATRKAAATVLQYYADELGELERELSLSDRYSSSSKELGALAGGTQAGPGGD